MEKCHNNIYLSKFLEFLELLFEYGSELTLLNAIIKVNVLSDLARFFMDFVHREDRPKPPKHIFMFFFKELAALMEKAASRPDCGKFKRELKSSLNWVYFKAMLKDNIKDSSSLLR